MLLEGVSCQICATTVATLLTRYQTARSLVIQGRRGGPSNGGFWSKLCQYGKRMPTRPHQRILDAVIGKFLHEFSGSFHVSNAPVRAPSSSFSGGGRDVPRSQVDMSTRYLLISDPPHDDVDAAEAASYFGLTVAEVRMKSNYGLSEVWFAEEDEAKLSDTAVALEAAGFNTALVAGSDLVEIPVQSPSESFVFMEGGLRVGRDDSEWTMAYDAPTIAVVCRPQVDVQDATSPVRPLASRLSSWGHVGTTRRGPDAGQAEFDTSPFLDFYGRLDDGLSRISIVQDITSFPPLPVDLPHGLSAMRNLVVECENRFEEAYFDHRLVDMKLRGTARVVTETRPRKPPRTGFSFATEALAGLLGSLSTDLKDISQADLSSRLAYLTNRSRTS